MNDEEQKQFIRYLARRVKELYRENLVLRAFAQYLKNEGYRDVDEIIESARQSPEVQARYEAYFRGFDELIPQADEEIQEKVLRDLLRGWEPNGPIN